MEAADASEGCGCVLEGFDNMHNVGIIFTEIINVLKVYCVWCVYLKKKSPEKKNIHNINKVITQTPKYVCEIFP